MALTLVNSETAASMLTYTFSEYDATTGDLLYTYVFSDHSTPLVLGSYTSGNPLTLSFYCPPIIYPNVSEIYVNGIAYSSTVYNTFSTPVIITTGSTASFGIGITQQSGSPKVYFAFNIIEDSYSALIKLEE